MARAASGVHALSAGGMVGVLVVELRLGWGREHTMPDIAP